MTAYEPILRAFGGALEGNRWVRVLYLDESGIGKITNDPIVVVAGVVVHADTQWGPLASKLEKLLSEAVPLGVKRPQHLHAKDIFHGSGEFPRETWDQARRNQLLHAVGSLVGEYNLPVVWSAADRGTHARKHPDDTPAQQLGDIYTICAVGCFMQAEAFMRQSHNDAEVCSIVMEQNHELQKGIPGMVAALKNPVEAFGELEPGWERIMPLRKLIDTPACQPKTASSILQLADYCAFAIKRVMQGSAGARRLTGPLAGNLLRYEDPKARAEGKVAFWSPIHMPTLWPYPVVLEGGQFKKVED